MILTPRTVHRGHSTQAVGGAISEYLGTQLDESEVVILVAEEHGAVVGYTYAGIEGRDYMALRGPSGALYDIVVDPARRGEGIGRKLRDATIAALSGRRCAVGRSLDRRAQRGSAAPVRARAGVQGGR